MAAESQFFCMGENDWGYSEPRVLQARPASC
jgi:hypothetical protein